MSARPVAASPMPPDWKAYAAAEAQSGHSQRGFARPALRAAALEMSPRPIGALPAAATEIVRQRRQSPQA